MAWVKKKRGKIVSVSRKKIEGYTEVKNTDIEDIKIENYVEDRLNEYPSLGDGLDILYKERQKRKLLVGKARKLKEEGKLEEAFDVICEAVEPIKEAAEYDARIRETKEKYKKS
jgi:hypothetical protein